MYKGHKIMSSNQKKGASRFFVIVILLQLIISIAFNVATIKYVLISLAFIFVFSADYSTNINRS